MPKRLVRSYAYTREFESAETIIYYYAPEVKHGRHKDYGLESTVELGKGDLEKLNYPKRIKVVIYNLD